MIKISEGKEFSLRNFKNRSIFTCFVDNMWVVLIREHIFLLYIEIPEINPQFMGITCKVMWKTC
jgi:hypothetical protein